MSWLFDEVDDYVTLADNAALTFPDGDWTVAGWIRLTDNTGSTFQYFLSWNAIDASNAFHLYIGEASQGGSATNKLISICIAENGVQYQNSSNQVSTTSVGTSTAWQHVALRFTRSTKTLQYFINGVADYSWVVEGTPGVINHSAPLYFGSRAVSPTGRFFGGRLAEFAKWDVELTPTQIANLAAGDSPSIVGAPTWYCPMTDLTESVSALTVTAYGGAAVDGDHPTINYGSSSVSSNLVSAYLIESSVTATLVASYEINTATSISSYLAASYAIRAAVASDLVANYSILEEVASDLVATYYVGLPVIYNSLDRGTVDLSNSSVTPNGSTPTIAVKNRWFTGDNSTGARFSFFHVTGVNGLTPVFDVDRSNMENSDASNKFLWSYTGDLGDWHEFGTTTKLSSPNVYRSQHGSAFTQDLVYVAMNYPWRVGYTLPWIESLESSGHIGYAPSGSDSYQFETRSATTNGSTSGVGDVVPAQPLYSFKIGSGGLAPNGLAKKSIVLSAGMHASEDVGNYALKGAVEFLVSENAQAVMVRDWFDIVVYPLVASAGRAGGSQRGDFEDTAKAEDVNRAWDGSPVLETITKHKAAVLSDAGTDIPVMLDFHGSTYSSTYFDYYTLGPKQAEWEAAIDAYRPGITINLLNGTDTAPAWFYNTKSTVYPITPEHNYITPYTLSDVEDFGADHVRAVAYLIAQGEFGLITVSSDIAASYAVLESVQSDIAASYEILTASAVASNLVSTYSISAAVQADIAALYSIRAAIQADVVAAYAIRAAIQSDIAAAYSILSAGAVASSLAASYDILGAVQSDCVATYAVREPVSTDLQATFIIRQQVSAGLAVVYFVRATVQSDLPASYQILALSVVASDLAALYFIDGVITAPQMPKADAIVTVTNKRNRVSVISRRS